MGTKSIQTPEKIPLSDQYDWVPRDLWIADLNILVQKTWLSGSKNVNFYVDEKKHFSKYIATEFALSFGCDTSFTLMREFNEIYKGVSVVFGKQCMGKMVPILLKRKLDFIFVDHSYFDRGYRGKSAPGKPPNFRIVANAIHPTKIQDMPSDRFEQFGLTVEDWKRGGEHILICPPTEFFYPMIQLKANWIQRCIHKIRDNTDRPIVLRPKEQNSVQLKILEEVCKTYKNISLSRNTLLADDLKNCWATVAPASNVSIEGLLKGIPSFSAHTSPAHSVSLQDVAKIESPIYPTKERKRLFRFLAYCQFSADEIRSGKALSIFKEMNKGLFKQFKYFEAMER